ncbi:hypothetical protein GCM10009687_06310 [Asanoa iriomotensis]|uniref:Uncharacterized protein n=1 Tax=Asanoa iriomotensis TaxID=234613 RepID=A0ABQ4C1N9_9ACTN|nr:hypothetical protein Air01nite_27770 [Asanoa iriomotensis]
MIAFTDLAEMPGVSITSIVLGVVTGACLADVVLVGSARRPTAMMDGSNDRPRSLRA